MRTKMKKPMCLMLVLLTGAGANAGETLQSAKEGPKSLDRSILSEGMDKSWKPGDPLSVLDGKVVFDVQERLRYEGRINTFDFNDRANAVGALTDGSILLQRFRLGMAWQPVSWLKLYAQGQDSREVSDRPKVPFILGAEGDDPFDLRQAFLEAGDFRELPVKLKFGRQTLSYGDERLVGASEWTNFGRTFDAAKFQILEDEWTRTQFDLFAGHVTNIRPRNQAEEDEMLFNPPSYDDTLAGVYASSTGLTFQRTEGYLLYRSKGSNYPLYSDTSQNVPAAAQNAAAFDIGQEVFTLGVRVASQPVEDLEGWDYEIECAYQFGTVDRQTAGGATAPGVGAGTYAGSSGTLDVNAWATHLQFGRTFPDVETSPRIGFLYDHATGDSNPTDGESTTFMNLFPTNHKFYGFMDLFSWKNVHDVALQASCKPADKVTLNVHQHFFWLDTTSDAWYRANGVSTVRPVNAVSRAAGDYAGSETDFTAAWQATPYLHVLVGYSHFFAGDYLRDTVGATVPPSGDDDADFGYVQATVQF